MRLALNDRRRTLVLVASILGSGLLVSALLVVGAHAAVPAAGVTYTANDGVTLVTVAVDANASTGRVTFALPHNPSV